MLDPIRSHDARLCFLGAQDGNLSAVYCFQNLFVSLRQINNRFRAPKKNYRKKFPICHHLIFLVNSLIWWIHAVSWQMSWRRDVVWLHRCILVPQSTSLISSGSQCCRLKVVRYRSLNCWMISTVRSTTPYHVTTSTRSVTLYVCCHVCVCAVIKV